LAFSCALACAAADVQQAMQQGQGSERLKEDDQ